MKNPWRVSYDGFLQNVERFFPDEPSAQQWTRQVGVYGKAKIEYVGTYRVFTRVWWRRNPNYPRGLEPYSGGRKTIIARHQSWESAKSICEVWNKNNKPGRLGRRCEFEKED